MGLIWVHFQVNCLGAGMCVYYIMLEKDINIKCSGVYIEDDLKMRQKYLLQLINYTPGNCNVL